MYITSTISDISDTSATVSVSHTTFDGNTAVGGFRQINQVCSNHPWHTRSRQTLHTAHRDIIPPTNLFPHATCNLPASLVDTYPLWRHVWLGGRRRSAAPDTLTPTHRSDHTAMGFGTAVTATAMGTDAAMGAGTGTDTGTDTIHVVPRMAHWLR